MSVEKEKSSSKTSFPSEQFDPEDGMTRGRDGHHEIPRKNPEPERTQRPANGVDRR